MQHPSIVYDGIVMLLLMVHARGFTVEQAQEIVNPETVPSMDPQCFRDYLPLLTGLAAEMREPPHTRRKTV